MGFSWVLLSMVFFQVRLLNVGISITWEAVLSLWGGSQRICHFQQRRVVWARWSLKTALNEWEDDSVAVSCVYSPRASRTHAGRWLCDSIYVRDLHSQSQGSKAQSGIARGWGRRGWAVAMTRWKVSVMHDAVIELRSTTCSCKEQCSVVERLDLLL